MGKYCDEKRGRRRDARGRKERAEEERNCTARVSYRVITIPGHFHPPPPPPILLSRRRTRAYPPHPPTSYPPLSLPLPTAAHDVFSDIKLFIVHNGVLRLSSSLGIKKEKEGGRGEGKKEGRENSNKEKKERRKRKERGWRR